MNSPSKRMDLDDDIDGNEQQQQHQQQQSQPALSDDENDASDDQNDTLNQTALMKTTALNNETRRSAKLAYGRVFKSIRQIDDDKYDMKTTVTKLSNCLMDENKCLMNYGINELLPMDAKNMLSVSEHSINLVKKLTIIKRFNVQEYRHKLRRNLLKNCMKHSNVSHFDPKKRLQLVHLYPTGKKYEKYFRNTPMIIGEFDTNRHQFDDQQKNDQTKPSKRIKRHRLPNDNEQIEPKQKQSNDHNTMDESDKRLEFIYKSLSKLQRKNENGVPFIQALINPRNFSTTIENIFNIAFLSKQGMIVIDDCDNGGDGDEINDYEPKIFVKNDQSSQMLTNKDPIQSVLSFDMNIYRKLLQIFNIQRPAIKD